MLENGLDCSGRRRFPAAVFMPLIDSAEKFRASGLNCQVIFPVRGVIDGLTPPISRLVDFVEGMPEALD